MIFKVGVFWTKKTNPYLVMTFGQQTIVAWDSKKHFNEQDHIFLTDAILQKKNRFYKIIFEILIRLVK